MKRLLTLLLFSVLSNIAFAQYTIGNVTWSDHVDNDGDGATRSRKISIPVTNTGSGLADVVLEIRAYPDGSADALYANSPEFFLFNGINTYTPIIGIGSSIGGELSNNTYDFRILLRQGVNGTILATRHATDDGDLNNELFETSAQDCAPSQPGPISGNITVCQGSVQTYTISPVSGATSYIWAPPVGWGSSSNTTTSLTITAGASSGTLTVFAENACGISPQRTLSITVAPAPSQPGSISGNTTVCQGSVQTYTISPVSGATSYIWAPPAGWGSSSNTTTSLTITAGASSGTLAAFAENACGISPQRDLSITVTPLPSQPGTISGNTTVCQGSSQTYSVPAVAGVTYTWSLPSGWSGSSSTNSITATASSIGGTVSVSSSNSCGISSNRTLPISVTTFPSIPGTISGNSQPCAGTSQTYSISPVAGATSYGWGIPSGWSGSSSTNSITVTAGSNSGTIQVSANNSCATMFGASLSVSPSTSISQPGTISGSTSLCSGTSQTYSVPAVSGATSYSWTLPSGWTGSSSTNSITGTASLFSGNISVTASSACFTSSPSSLFILVNTPLAQPGTIAGSTTVCQGSSQTYSIAAVAGASSYTWTLPSGWTGSSISTSIIVTPSTTSGNVSVVANGGGCGSSVARTLSITVTASPAQPGTISGSASACQGVSTTYSISAVSGATSYTWTMPSGWSGSSTTTSITTTPGTTSGTISVAAVNSCAMGTARTLSVTVSPTLSQPGAISSNASACVGTSVTYQVASMTGATSYNWTLPSGWTGSSTTNSITATIGATGGNVSVTASNSCFTSTAQSVAITTLTIPPQPASITGAASICQSTSQPYSITAVSGATSYSWTLPSGWTGASTTTSISTTVGPSAGSISVTAGNTCGNSNPRSLAVTVSPVPSQPGSITGSAAVCEGASNTYLIAAVSGASSYIWTLPAGWSGTSATTSITTTAGSASGTISVVAVNSCGNSVARTLAITANPALPQPAAISGSASVCAGTSQTYTIASVSGATSYTWTLPSGWTGSSTSASITATAGSSGGTLSVVAMNACFSSTVRTLALSVVTIPPQPGTITGTAAVCQGSSQSYSVSAVSGASSYSWSLPSGWTGSSTTTSINATAGSTSGNISVAATNGCGTSNVRTLAIAASTLPSQPAGITGNLNVCQASSQTYSTAAVAGATSYTWTLPGGWSGTSTTSSISATPGAGGGTVSLAAVNSCGTGTVRTISVTSTPALTQPTSITGSTAVCNETSQTYSIVALAGATSYSWTIPSGWTGSSASTSITATARTSGGNVSVTASNSCFNTTPVTLAVALSSTPPQPAGMSGSSSTCQGSEKTYSITSVIGATSYTWSTPSTWSGTSQTNSLTTVPGATSGNVSVTANNSCGSSTPRTLSVAVSALPPEPGIIEGNTAICAGTTQTYTISNVSGATSYTWTLPSGWMGSSISTTIIADAGTSGGDITVSAVNACGNGPARTLAVSTGAALAAPGPISGRTFVSTNASETYSVDPIPGAQGYIWTAPTGWTGSSATNSITYTVSPMGGDVVVYTSNACGYSSPKTLRVTIDNTPPIVTVIPAATVQSGSSATITVQADDPESGITTAVIKYRSITAGGPLLTLPLLKSGTNRTVEIPASEIGELGLEYKIEVVNGAGRDVVLPTDPDLYTLRVKYQSLEIPYSSFGSESSNYRIVGVPLNLTLASFNNVFGDELGTYNAEQWRVFRYDLGKTSELTGQSMLEPGKGYWLIARSNPGGLLLSGEGTSVVAETAAPMTIPLAVNWNMIGNPYNFDLSMTDVKAANPLLSSNEVMIFTGVGQGYEARNVLRKMEGGFVYSNATLKMAVPVKKNTGIGRSAAPAITSIDSTDWQLGLYFDLIDGKPISGIGMNQGAVEGFDNFDRLIPPTMGEFVELTHALAKSSGVSLTKDIVPPADDHVWTFDIKGPERMVYLQWNELAGERKKLVLYDHENETTIDMSQVNRYPVTPPGRFSVYLGSEEFIKRELPGARLSIMNVFPNPASDSFNVELALPAMTAGFEVQISVIDVQGREIRLGTQQLAAGYHSMHIDRRDNLLSPGIYLIRVVAGGKAAFRKVVITK